MLLSVVSEAMEGGGAITGKDVEREVDSRRRESESKDKGKE